MRYRLLVPEGHVVARRHRGDEVDLSKKTADLVRMKFGDEALERVEQDELKPGPSVSSPMQSGDEAGESNVTLSSADTKLTQLPKTTGRKRRRKS